MTSPAWAKVEELFHAALERAPAEREAFLDGACGGDEELGREVQSLLAEEREAERLMEEPAAGAATQKVAVTRGTQLGPYEVKDLIGAGGMGEVYRATDTRLGRDVAVKVLPADFASDKERLRRFEHEARAVASLNHPHILTVHDVGTHEGTPYVVTELLEGETLREVLSRPRRAPSLKQALSYAVQAAQGLAAAHRKGVVHRDMKPENLFVTRDGQVKVLDFGLAKHVVPAAEGEPGATVSTTTGDGVVMGTGAYMSPEQAQGLAVDARSDVFSFGVVLYELLTHKHPFRRDTPTATLGAILETEPKAPGEITAGLPHDLEKLVLRCLRKDPERRFQSLTDVQLELEEVAAELASPPPGSAPAPRRKWLWPVAGGAAVLIALAAAVATRFASTPAPPPKLVQLTTLPGVERRPAFSPDGQQLAFVWGGDDGDNLDVYVMSVAGGSPLRLTNDPSEEDFPAWSPDGRRIAFRRLAGFLSSLHVVSSLGGPVTKVADLGPVGDHGLPYPSLAWTPDGRSLVAAHRGPDGGALLLVPVEQGERRLLLANDGRLVCPAVSPDGRLLAYGACLRPWVCDVFVSALGPDGLEGSPRRVTPQSFNNLQGLSWSRDGRSLLYSNTGGDLARLWRVPASGDAPPERLELPGTGAFDPAASRASDRLAFSREYLGDEDIWSLERGQPARPFLAHTAMDAFPEFSPDGRRLAFSSGRSGDRVAIQVADADGSNPVALTSGAGGGQGSPAWSPDGRRIAFDAGRPDSSTAVIFVADSDGGAARQLTESRADDFCPAWSRDGRWVYFCSNRSGRFEIWRVPSEGGDATQVTDTGGVRPVVSPDGRTLYYLRQEFRSPLFARPIAGGEERQVVDSVSRMQYVVREDGLYYFSPVGGGSHATLPWGTVIDRGDTLRFLDFATGRSRQLATVHDLGRGLTVSPDGRTILYTVRKPPSADLMLIENFR